jgi:hypothetical protein
MSTWTEWFLFVFLAILGMALVITGASLIGLPYGLMAYGAMILLGLIMQDVTKQRTNVARENNEGEG